MKRNPKNPYPDVQRQRYKDISSPNSGVSSDAKIKNVTPASDESSQLLKTRPASSNINSGRRSDNIAAKSRSGSTRRISDSSKRQTVVLDRPKRYIQDEKPYNAYTPTKRNPEGSGMYDYDDLGPKTIDLNDDSRVRTAADIKKKNENISLAELLDAASSSGRDIDIPSINTSDQLSVSKYRSEKNYQESRRPQGSGYVRRGSRPKDTGYSGRNVPSRRVGSYYSSDYYNDYDDDDYYDDYYSRRSKKHISGFKIFLIVYCAVFLVAIAAGFFILTAFASAYEKAQPYHIADNIVDTFSNESTLNLYLSENWDLTDCLENSSEILDGYLEVVKDRTISYSENSDYRIEAPSYDIKADGVTIAKITLDSSGKGSFGLDKWEVASIGISAYITPFSYLIYAPSDSKITVNGSVLDDTYISSEAKIPEELTEAAQFVSDIPEFVTYTISLAGTPEIEAVNSSGEALSVSASEDNTFVIGCDASDEFISSVETVVYGAITSWGEYFIHMGYALSYYIHPDCEWYAYIFGSDDMDPIYTAFYDYEYIASYEFTEKNATNYVKYADDCFTVDVSYNIKITFTTDERSDNNQNLNATWVFVPEPYGDGWVIVDCFYKEDTVSEEAADEDTES